MFKNLYEAPQELATGGYVTRELHSVTVHFDDIHYSLSSGQLNGGYHHTLAVRNQQLTYQIETEKDLPGGSVADYLAQEFEHIDTPVHFSTALLTSATMHLHAYAKVEEHDTIVETIVTAGYEKTAHRAGTGYCYEERDGDFIVPGTINILVFTNKALTDSAMVKAIMTITEAKPQPYKIGMLKAYASIRLLTKTFLTQLRKNVKHLPQVPLQMVSFSPSIQMEIS